MVHTTSAAPNRWLIAVMGTLLQLCLGTVYAWSYFQKPLAEQNHWSQAQVAMIFSLAICFLGIAAAWGGMNLAKYGPRELAMLGGALFGLGYILGSLALKLHSLPLLYVGYGVIGGTGLGLGYVTPVATVAKWFPDKKGLVTGMVVMGFGFGALLMSKVLAPGLMKATGDDLVLVFGTFGIAFTGVTLVVASHLRNPPAGYAPSGYIPPAAGSSAASEPGLTARECLLSRRFALLWIVFFCNITAGIAIIGFQSPLMQDLWKRLDPALPAKTLAAYGATLIAVSSIFNGVGRFFWGGASDRIGRTLTFRIMLGTQIVAFVALMGVGSTGALGGLGPWVFGALICYVLLCYGGGFGTMPSFVLDVYGQKLMPVVYGAILTAWSAAGLVGPQIVGRISDYCKANHLGTQMVARYSFITGACFLALGLLASVALSNAPFRRPAEAAASPRTIP